MVLDSTSLPAPSSITHAHLLACINSVLQTGCSGTTHRILDAGCGNGGLLAYLASTLPVLHPSCDIELFGFDIGDHGVQEAGFFDETIARLEAAVATVRWAERLRLVTATDPWPFAEEHFDLVISNQVLEHVHDKANFFSELHRVLIDGGTSFHLFPLQHYVWEGHLNLPFVHWVGSSEVRDSLVTGLSRLGLGKFRAQNAERGVSAGDFGREHSDYIQFWTSYATEKEILSLSAQNRLRASFRFTPEFYAQKVRALRRQPLRTSYATDRSGLLDAATVKALRYVSSVTLTLEKNNAYRKMSSD